MKQKQSTPSLPVRSENRAGGIIQSEREALERELKRTKENKEIKELIKNWQQKWHDLFDQDSKLLESGEFVRDNPIPDDIRTDFRLIFGISHASLGTQRACFDLFPEGKEMFRRFNDYFHGTYEVLDETEARKLLGDLAAAITVLKPTEILDWADVAVMTWEKLDESGLLQETYPLSEVIETATLQCAVIDEDRLRLKKWAANTFLSEPLYMSAGNVYELRDWVTGAMFDPAEDNVNRIVFKLHCSNWSIRQDGQKVYLVKRT
ncbi:hypothetical protein [Roseovarius rhodophyticola]|uniref:Uncharacterized protein n=1 Tax=Roseovarius rhodophyticola TaxID=3080827 RepID=A0ABZ2TBF9_9RHOB|nr:hypothetical protein [Roseovarius sp. W115]MDV2930707.1 hypothetical protein [Roseovarius sp. W115]